MTSQAHAIPDQAYVPQPRHNVYYAAGGGPMLYPDETNYICGLLRAQVEYYFSDSNLPTDAYLQNVLQEYQGRVPISLISSFPKIQQIYHSHSNPSVDCCALISRAIAGMSRIVQADSQYLYPLTQQPVHQQQPDNNQDNDHDNVVAAATGANTVSSSSSSEEDEETAWTTSSKNQSRKNQNNNNNKNNTNSNTVTTCSPTSFVSETTSTNVTLTISSVGEISQEQVGNAFPGSTSVSSVANNTWRVTFLSYEEANLATMAAKSIDWIENVQWTHDELGASAREADYGIYSDENHPSFPEQSQHFAATSHEGYAHFNNYYPHNPLPYGMRIEHQYLHQQIHHGYNGKQNVMVYPEHQQLPPVYYTVAYPSVHDLSGVPYQQYMQNSMANMYQAPGMAIPMAKGIVVDPNYYASYIYHYNNLQPPNESARETLDGETDGSRPSFVPIAAGPPPNVVYVPPTETTAVPSQESSNAQEETEKKVNADVNKNTGFRGNRGHNDNKRNNRQQNRRPDSRNDKKQQDKNQNSNRKQRDDGTKGRDMEKGNNNNHNGSHNNRRGKKKPYRKNRQQDKILTEEHFPALVTDGIQKKAADTLQEGTKKGYAEALKKQNIAKAEAAAKSDNAQPGPENAGKNSKPEVNQESSS